MPVVRLLAALSAAAAGGAARPPPPGLPDPAPTLPPADFDELNRLLAPLHFTPPTFEVSYGGGTLTLSNADCGNASVATLSAPSAPAAGGGVEAALVASRVSVSCFATVDAAVPILPSVRGNNITFTAAINLTMRGALAPAAEGGAPGELALEGCDAAAPVFDTDCEARGLISLCPIVKTVLPGLVKGAINATLCGELEALAAPGGALARAAALAAAALDGAAAPQPPPPKPREMEAYLAPFLPELAPFKKHNGYVLVGKLIDFTPTWLINFVIGRVFPKGTLNVTLPLDIPADLPFGLGTANLSVESAEITGLNKFKGLKPATLQGGGGFTWRCRFGIKRATAALETRVTLSPGASVEGAPGDGVIRTRVSAEIEHIEVDAYIVVAINASRLCALSGPTLTSSAACLAWPALWAHDQAGDAVSGVNLTALRVSVGSVTLAGAGLGPGAGGAAAEAVAAVLRAYGPAVLRALPEGLSAALRAAGNAVVTAEIAELQAQGGELCYANETGEVPPVSRVCVANNVVPMTMSYKLHDCASGGVSKGSGVMVPSARRCLDVTGAREGDIIRVATDGSLGAGVLGRRELADPALRYEAGGNVAVFACRGANLAYGCHLTGLTPPVDAPAVARICVTNSAPMALRWKAHDLRSDESSPGSGTYVMSYTRCIELGDIPGVADGDGVEAVVNAVIGFKRRTAPVVYRANSLTATFVCRGAQVAFACKLLAGGAPVARE